MQKYLFLIVVIAQICFSLELEILVPCLPGLAEFFNVSPDKMPLIVSINMLGFCVSSLYWGAIIPIEGAKKTFLKGAGIFAIGSLGCLLSQSFEMFLLFRFIQGLGGSGGIVVAFVVATNAPSDQVSGRLGIMSGASTVALAAGPLVGNLLLELGGIKANQTFLFIYACINVALLYFVMPKDDPEIKNQGISWKVILTSNAKMLLIPGFVLRLITKDLLVTAYLTYLGWSAFIIREEWGLSPSFYSAFQFALVASFAGLSLGMGKLVKNVSGSNINKLILLFFCLSFFFLFCSQLEGEWKYLLSFLSVWSYAIACAPSLNRLIAEAYQEVESSKEYATGLMTIMRYAVPACFITLITESFEPSWRSWSVVYPGFIALAGVMMLFMALGRIYSKGVAPELKKSLSSPS